MSPWSHALGGGQLAPLFLLCFLSVWQTQRVEVRQLFFNKCALYVLFTRTSWIIGDIKNKDLIERGFFSICDCFDFFGKFSFCGVAMWTWWPRGIQDGVPRENHTGWSDCWSVPYAAHGHSIHARTGGYGPSGYAVHGLVVQEGEDLSARTVLATGTNPDLGLFSNFRGWKMRST